jgi:hypothetical protein
MPLIICAFGRFEGRGSGHVNLARPFKAGDIEGRDTRRGQRRLISTVADRDGLCFQHPVPGLKRPGYIQMAAAAASLSMCVWPSPAINMRHQARRRRSDHAGQNNNRRVLKQSLKWRPMDENQ